MSKPGQPPEGMSPEPTATTVVEPKPKRRITRKTGENVLAAGAAAVGFVHVFVDGPKESGAESKKKAADGPVVKSPEASAHPDWKHNPVGEIVSDTTFRSERSTGGIQDDFVDLFKDVFEAPVGTFFYFDASGKVLLTEMETEPLRRSRESIDSLQAEAEKPKADVGKIQRQIDELVSERKRLIQPWHNANRARAGGPAVTPDNYADWGYPFVSTPTIKSTRLESGAESLIQVVTERLRQPISSGSTKPEYFNGETRTLYDAITEIAKAYDIPRAIILGIGANESGYNRFAKSEADARGIFQIKEHAFSDAKAYIEKHPELGSALRSGSVTGTFDGSALDNRLVSAELCCAYYAQTKEWLKKDVRALEDRLSQVDPSFPAGSLLTIATINGYNAGAGNIKLCIKRFVSLSDEEIRARLGEPPYGADAWLGVIALSYGVANAKGEIAIGPDVFMYPQKILAMGSLIMAEENALFSADRVRVQSMLPSLPDLPSLPELPSRRSFWDSFAKATGIAAAVAGFTSLADTTRDRRSRPEGGAMTRRDALKLGAASVGLASPFARKGREWLGSEEPEEEVIEPYADSVEGDAARALDALDAELRIRAADGESGWTPDEKTEKSQFKAPQNRALLLPKFEDMLGKDMIKRLDRAGSTADKMKLYVEADALQRKYVAREVAAGNIVPVNADDPANPFFCEQVGVAGGIGNNPEALYVRREFLTVTRTLLILVNRQIDAFNENPTTYGIRDANFPILPHISALKISSMLRPTSVTGDLMTSGKGGATTKSGMTPHWLGSAIDIASYATKPWKNKKTGLMEGVMGHMARLEGDLLSAKNGTVLVPAGGLLDNGGSGERTREILSKMVGRALFAMREPLERREGIIIQPLWEAGQLNWHIALDVIETVEAVETKP